MRTLKPLVYLALLAGGVSAGTPMLLAREKRAQVDSRWRDAPIAIDGSPLDWPGGLAPFGDQPVSMAAANDGESLFLVMTASEPAVRSQILRRGLIVWFDPAGKDRKRFGVKFPIGGGFTADGRRGRGAGGRPDGSTEGAGAERPARGGAGSDNQGPPPDAGPEPPNRLELLGASKDDARSFTADRAPGIEVRIGQAEGLLTYELKVPLAANDAHPYAVGARPGAAIGVGLEMPKLERPERPGREGGGGRGPGGGGVGGRIGGMGGMGGGMGGRGRGGVRDDRPDQAKPLSGWVTLRLSSR